MNDLEIQLARAEQELLADETALHTELERLQGLLAEFNDRLERAQETAAGAYQVRAIDAVLTESINRVVLRPIDADGIGANARQARELAVRARRDAANHLRHSITAWKSSYKAISNQLTNDEKSVQRGLAANKTKAKIPMLKPVSKPPPPVPDEVPRITSLMYETEMDMTPPSTPGLGDDEVDIVMATGMMYAQGVPAPPPPVPLGAEPIPKTEEQFAPKEDRPRRSRPRVRMQAQVNITSLDTLYQGLSANISDGGLFVATENIVPVGTEVDVTFALEGRHIESRGVVKWVRRPDEKNPAALSGIGIQFLEIDEDARKLVQRYVSQREPIFFDDV